MTDDEKLGKTKLMIEPEVASDGLLLMLLDFAGQKIINRAYPFRDDVTAVPPRYEALQIRAAVALYSKLGAEDQISHNENGISRAWESGDLSASLMREIMPQCGGVMVTNANP